MGMLIEVHEIGDPVYTMNEGKLRKWIVQPDGTLKEVPVFDHPATTYGGAHE